MAILKDNKQHDDYIKSMENYIRSFESMTPAEAKKEARNSLMRSGILTKKGKIKKNIVNR